MIRSFQLWIVSLVIGVISAVVGFLTFDSIRDDLIADMQEQMPDMSRDQIETVVTISNIASVGFYLAILGAILFLVFQMKSGKNWARITLTIVGGINVLLSLLALAGGGVGSLIQLVSAGVIVAAIVFMYRADAASYFQKRPQY
ncbi:hypothetical protein GCM10011410_30870 [Hoyosella rhizosphaerae]|uniref:DUF2127 domain-containing protein n=1 Tax=Hoyosella rhizosphaerae TaxID=1755582 RepID=A0A916XI84_9ACTN|nr:hypothetical protein GCM10011410_30870 [Hoyosella rhizosphaerae]